MACHFRIAASSARFGQPETKLGLIPGFGGTQRLPRLIRRNEALRLILTGEIISADQALALGMIDQVVEDANLMQAVERLANQFAGSSATATAAASDRLAALGRRDSGGTSGRGKAIRHSNEQS